MKSSHVLLLAIGALLLVAPVFGSFDEGLTTEELEEQSKKTQGVDNDEEQETELDEDFGENPQGADDEWGATGEVDNSWEESEWEDVQARQTAAETKSGVNGIRIPSADLQRIFHILRYPADGGETATITVNNFPAKFPYSAGHRTDLTITVSSATQRITEANGCFTFVFKDAQPAVMRDINSTTVGCQLSGNVMVKLFLYFGHVLGSSSGTLEDASEISCRPGAGQASTTLSLMDLGLMVNLTSWYARLGWVPRFDMNDDLPDRIETAKVDVDPSSPLADYVAAQEIDANQAGSLRALVTLLYNKIRADSAAFSECALLVELKPQYDRVVDASNLRNKFGAMQIKLNDLASLQL
eukprot:gnl/Hemi2/19125_TR6342_c0_g1_i1.p1 gnl/Hemi2/19125_TR6342_c0_g1~~gnl/Hemi2/19125_TR6342_c0_g1_i1.p1  ORF type:complete len:355 (+),score=97.65 gnl/Hemi2/19125_TR6342_c0_g1_i1:58-1122(+)